MSLLFRQSSLAGLFKGFRPLIGGNSGLLDAGTSIETFSNFEQQRYKRKGRKKKDRPKPTEEQLATKGNPNERRKDHVGVPEPSYSIARHVKEQVTRTLNGFVKQDHIRKRNTYRLSKLLGNTHDESVDPIPSTERSFVTPLTTLQHQASLPQSPTHERFSFPHTLHYRVFWGGSLETDREGHGYECFVSMRLEELGLSSGQKKRLLDIVGLERYDEAEGLVVLDADLFDNRNQNASFLGDNLEKLMREVKSVL